MEHYPDKVVPNFIQYGPLSYGNTAKWRNTLYSVMKFRVSARNK